MKKYFLIFCLISCLSIQSVLSQEYHTTSNRALKSYRQGTEAYEFFDFSAAEQYFREAINIDKKFFEAHLMLGELLNKQKRHTEAAAEYSEAIKIDSLFYKPVFFNLAISEMFSGDYSRALMHFNVYLAQEGMKEANINIAERRVLDCKFALNAIKNPVQFSPVSAGNGINTQNDEYWPSITADGQTLMFTRQARIVGDPPQFSRGEEDFYISYLSGNSWQTAVNAGPPLNTPNNEGAQTLSSNGNYMYFTACDRPGSMGSCDLYFSSFNDGNWSVPVNLGPPVNTSSWESTPSISADGKTLYFSSTRPGGFGGKDLWFSRIDEKNRWSSPVNMGKVINTAGEEMSPFIHFDGKTLYFASDGRVGMGGFDIYISRLINDSTWSEPQNLGYPINTFNDETGLIIESGGQKAYYSSIRDKANGKDIFVFNLYESARPDPVSYLKGKVYDKETGKLLKAEYELINLSTIKPSVKNTTDGSGNFLVCLPSGYNYGLNISKPGYLFYMFEGVHTLKEPLVKRIVLSPVKVGEKMMLANVFYEFDSWELKKESKSELNNLAKLISDNSVLEMEIGGYTDSTGTAGYNQTLSEKRALSVVNYLISKGIPAERLKYKGYGSASPIGDNNTEEGRKMNRRTEAKILELKK
jgi:tetratricopeptide (TPR) repeat protein